MPVHGHLDGRLVGPDAPDLALATVGGSCLIDCHQKCISPGVRVAVGQDAEDVLEGQRLIVELNGAVDRSPCEGQCCGRHHAVGPVIQEASGAVGKDQHVGDWIR